MTTDTIPAPSKFARVRAFFLESIREVVFITVGVFVALYADGIKDKRSDISAVKSRLQLVRQELAGNLRLLDVYSRYPENAQDVKVIALKPDAALVEACLSDDRIFEVLSASDVAGLQLYVRNIRSIALVHDHFSELFTKPNQVPPEAWKRQYRSFVLSLRRSCLEVNADSVMIERMFRRIQFEKPEMKQFSEDQKTRNAVVEAMQNGTYKAVDFLK